MAPPLTIPAEAGIQEPRHVTTLCIHPSQQAEWNPVRRRHRDLARRVWEHKNDFVEGFTERYGVHTLVWYEAHESMESALVREKAIKKWKRAWKIRQIEEGNPTWSDLYEEIA